MSKLSSAYIALLYRFLYVIDSLVPVSAGRHMLIVRAACIPGPVRSNDPVRGIVENNGSGWDERYENIQTDGDQSFITLLSLNQALFPHCRFRAGTGYIDRNVEPSRAMTSNRKELSLMSLINLG